MTGDCLEHKRRICFMFLCEFMNIIIQHGFQNLSPLVSSRDLTKRVRAVGDFFGRHFVQIVPDAVNGLLWVICITKLTRILFGKIDQFLCHGFF